MIMAEAMSTAPEGETREQAYQRLAREIASVVAGETSATARYATAACLLAHAFAPRFFWTGFYVVDPLKPRELVVGPYQGTLGCLRIPFGKGVCGGGGVGRNADCPRCGSLPRPYRLRQPLPLGNRGAGVCARRIAGGCAGCRFDGA